ncbi:virulence factor TspB C-terminal domain-related protein [Pseudomonas anguilliseptica]|nr:virulence factor TspB C-terminal domain-related protein [Pseudomonas anguilliseptica]
MKLPRLFIRMVIALGLIGWGQFVFSAPYVWTVSGHGNHTGSSPMSAAQSAKSANGWVSVDWCISQTDSQFGCRTNWQPGVWYFDFTVLRSGDSCSDPLAIFNPATGECEAPEPDQCEPTVGVEVEHRHRAGEFTGAGVIAGRVDPPGSVCLPKVNGCQYSFTYSAPVDAYRFEAGDPSGVFLKLKYRGNGVSCTGNESEFAQPSDGTPVVEKQSECTTKITDAEGRQRYDCQATELNIDPGNMECDLGTVGGELQCIPKPPSPQMTDKKVDQEIVEKTNPDGSKDTTTTTTTTTTKCTGVKSCSTSTTTNVSNNHTKADGTPGGESNTCTGPGCKDADGKTQEEREEEEEEKNESKVTGGQTCEAAPACEGDAVQCAILKQQYEARCDFEESEDFESNKADIKGLFEGQGDKFKLDEGSGDIDVPSFINQGTRFLPATCPAAESFSLTTAGGRTFTLSYEPLCRAASDLSGLFVAVATILAALYVGRSVGGN